MTGLCLLVFSTGWCIYSTRGCSSLVVLLRCALSHPHLLNNFAELVAPEGATPSPNVRSFNQHTIFIKLTPVYSLSGTSKSTFFPNMMPPWSLTWDPLNSTYIKPLGNWVSKMVLLLRWLSRRPIKKFECEQARFLG